MRRGGENRNRKKGFRLISIRNAVPPGKTDDEDVKHIFATIALNDCEPMIELEKNAKTQSVSPAAHLTLPSHHNLAFIHFPLLHVITVSSQGLEIRARRRWPDDDTITTSKRTAITETTPAYTLSHGPVLPDFFSNNTPSALLVPF